MALSKVFYSVLQSSRSKSSQSWSLSGVEDRMVDRLHPRHFLAIGFRSVHVPNNSFKPTPLRGAA